MSFEVDSPVACELNFTEGPKQKQKSHTHTDTGQIPISSLHILSTNVNLELFLSHQRLTKKQDLWNRKKLDLESSNL